MDDGSKVTRAMITVTALSAFVLLSPLIAMHPPWFFIWAIAMVLPYGVVAARAVQHPHDRSGPALVFGICAVMITIAGLLIAVQWGRRELLPHIFNLSLLAAHAVLLYFAIEQYRRGNSNKPHWRLLLRGFIDPLVYYGIAFILAAGMSMHLD